MIVTLNQSASAEKQSVARSLVLWSIHRWRVSEIYFTSWFFLWLGVYTTLRTDDTDCHLLVVVQWFCQLNRPCCKLLQQTNSILIARVQREDPNMKGIVGWISTEKPKRVICEIDFIWSKLIYKTNNENSNWISLSKPTNMTKDN
jgi:hypothetical protein